MQPIEHAWTFLKSWQEEMTQTDPGYPEGKGPDMPGMGEMQTWRDQLRAKYEANRRMQDLSHQDLLNEISMARHHANQESGGPTPHPETGELIAPQMQEHLEEAMHEYRLRVGEGTAEYPMNIPS